MPPPDGSAAAPPDAPPEPDQPVAMPPPVADAVPPGAPPPDSQPAAGDDAPDAPAAAPAPDAGEPPPGAVLPEAGPPPDVPAPEPSQPVPPPAPPVVPQTVGASNATPLLPHNSLGGVSRAAALFERIFTIADDAAGGSGDDAQLAVARIKGICEAAIGDVGRFAPVAMRQAAADEADTLISSL